MSEKKVKIVFTGILVLIAFIAVRLTQQNYRLIAVETAVAAETR